MLFLCLAIVSSCAIALLMRISSDKISAKLSMLGVNYLICTLLSAGYAGFDLICPEVSGFPVAIGMGLFNGILFLGGFVLCQWNTKHNGIVMTSVFMKLGLLVPIALSVPVFRERPTGVQIVGFAIALVAIVLINSGNKTGKVRFRWQLLVMLLMCGGADAMSKVFEVFGPAVLEDQFLFYTFLMALGLCAALVISKKERPGMREVLFGIAIGIPNFFASKFLLLALGRLPSVVVFPSFSIGTMLITTLVGMIFYRERLRKLQWLALLAIVSALLLLNI